MFWQAPNKICLNVPLEQMERMVNFDEILELNKLHNKMFKSNRSTC